MVNYIEIGKLIIAILIPNLQGFLIGKFTVAGVTTWYKTLEKSPLTPPPWVFPIAWTTLYTLMGIASYLVYRDGKGFTGPAKTALICYAINIVLNALWSILFFGFHLVTWAFAEIIVLLLSIISCIYTFYPVNSIAAFLLLPYLLWVTFASYLNYYIMMNNPGSKNE